MAVERGDSDATVGGISVDNPSTFEQSSLRGTTETGNARLVVRDATQIDIIDTLAYFTSNTVEGALQELAAYNTLNDADITSLQGQITSNDSDISALDGRVTVNETDIDNLVVGQFYWGNIIGTLSNQTDLQDALDLKSDITYVDTQDTASIAAAATYSDTQDALKFDKTGGLLTGVTTISAGVASPLVLTRSTQVGLTFNQTSFVRYLGSHDGDLYYGTAANHGSNEKIATENYVDTKVSKTGNETIAGRKTFTSELNVLLNTSSPTYAGGHVELQSDDGSDVSIGFHRLGSTACQLRHEDDGLILSGLSRTAPAALTVVGQVSSSAAAPTAASHLTRKDYVDGLLGGSAVLTKIIDLGDWNMDATSATGVTHGLDSSKIRTTVITIRHDNGVNLYDFASYRNSGLSTANDNMIRTNATEVTIQRETGGVFDNVDFNSTSFNRGWVTIQYIP